MTTSEHNGRGRGSRPTDNSAPNVRYLGLTSERGSTDRLPLTRPGTERAPPPWANGVLPDGVAWTPGRCPSVACGAARRPVRASLPGCGCGGPWRANQLAVGPFPGWIACPSTSRPRSRSRGHGDTRAAPCCRLRVPRRGAARPAWSTSVLPSIAVEGWVSSSQMPRHMPSVSIGDGSLPKQLAICTPEPLVDRGS